jgi:hypothetical protein
VNVLERLKALKGLGIDDIAKLPAMSNEETEMVAGKKVKFITWHDELESGEHRVVVASYEPHALASYRVDAAGFAMNHNGATRDLTDQEMDSFK